MNYLTHTNASCRTRKKELDEMTLVKKEVFSPTPEGVIGDVTDMNESSQ